jgi:hypothetical protein
MAWPRNIDVLEVVFWFDFKIPFKDEGAFLSLEKAGSCGQKRINIVKHRYQLMTSN